MNKKLIVILAAALLLVAATATACKDDEKPQPKPDPAVTTDGATGDYAVLGTDESGNEVTGPTEPGETTPGNNNGTTADMYEADPDFNDVEKKIYVLTDNARIRNSTKSDSTKVSSADKGDLLNADGESDKWFRIKTEDGETAYISKLVAADNGLLDGFVEVNDKITPKDNVNSVHARTFPYLSEYTVGTFLRKDAEVQRVGKTDKWSIVEIDGEKYYVSNDVIKQIDGSEITTVAPETNAPAESDTTAAQ